jgi:septal ring factor EnvC (AmiA/AmiB activator)
LKTLFSCRSKGVGLSVALSAALTFVPGGFASAKNLAEIKSQISALESSLADKKIEYDSARDAVLKIERQLHTARQENIQLRAQLATKMQHIEALRAQRSAMDDRREASIGAINSLLLARYKQSRHPKLKVILENTDLSALQRNLKYYDTLANAENERIREQSARASELEQVETALKLEATKLRRMRGQTEAQLNALNESFENRTRVAKSLASLLRDSKESLEQLRRDETELADLVEEVIEEATPQAVSPMPFGGLKGKLAWPTDGRIAKAPGTAMRDGGAKWSGVIIESSPGTDVAAVAAGRIAFADWFRNLGLLVIIDHGDGYMSLYGHNREVHKTAGDNVQTGDIVASVGDTGGRISAGLYFEIRENGTPQDPRLWCRK